MTYEKMLEIVSEEFKKAFEVRRERVERTSKNPEILAVLGDKWGTDFEWVSPPALEFDAERPAWVKCQFIQLAIGLGADGISEEDFRLRYGVPGGQTLARFAMAKGLVSFDAPSGHLFTTMWMSGRPLHDWEHVPRMTVGVYGWGSDGRPQR